MNGLPRWREAALSLLFVCLCANHAFAQLVANGVPVATGGGTGWAKTADTEFDSNHGVFLVASSEHQNTPGGRVWGSFLGSSGTAVIGTAFRLDSTGSFPNGPAVAYSPQDDVFLVVWANDMGHVRGRLACLVGESEAALHTQRTFIPDPPRERGQAQPDRLGESSGRTIFGDPPLNKRPECLLGHRILRDSCSTLRVGPPQVRWTIVRGRIILKRRACWGAPTATPLSARGRRTGPAVARTPGVVTGGAGGSCRARSLVHVRRGTRSQQSLTSQTAGGRAGAARDC